MSLFDRLQKSTAARRERNERIPPGQHETKGFPVLTYGPTPNITREEWRLRLFGSLDGEATIEFDDLMAMPQTTVTRDIHCVTTWSRLDAQFTGVLVRDLLAALSGRVKVLPQAQHVMQHCYGGYTTNTPLAELLEDDVMLAHTFAGEPLDADHGGPVRLVLPKLYFWKSAKWLRGLEFMTEDRRGFWEVNGYHNYGDPWKEQRFSSQE